MGSIQVALLETIVNKCQAGNRPMVAYVATLALRAAEAEAAAGQEGSRRLRTLALRTVRCSSPVNKVSLSSAAP
jgi:hypothetical protein